jgi:hypothetical protein
MKRAKQEEDCVMHERYAVNLLTIHLKRQFCILKNCWKVTEEEEEINSEFSMPSFLSLEFLSSFFFFLVSELDREKVSERKLNRNTQS